MGETGIVLVGAGGHGRVALDALLSAGLPMRGIVDPRLRVGDALFGVPVLGDDSWLDSGDREALRVVIGIGAVPRSSARPNAFLRIRAQGYRFQSLIHPSATVSREVVVSEGAQVMAGAVLQCGVTLGENSVANTRVSIDHDCIIAAHVFLGPAAVLCGEVRVGDGAFIGAGAVLLPGVAIGSSAVVGAGSIVTRDVAAGATVVGNPARQKGGA